jgi:AcrR family transcriptional regulator
MRDPATGSRPKDRKATIVAVAGELFAERGVAAVGVGEIAEKVGITGGAVYRHFAGKDALFEAVALTALDAFVGCAARERPSGATADERLRLVLADMVRAMLDHPDALAAYLRERDRLRADGASTLGQRETEWSALWSMLVRAARPELDAAAIEVRSEAVNGALAHAGRRAEPVARPRLDHLLTSAVSAVVVAPVPRDLPRLGVHHPTWTPPVSRRDEILIAALALFRQHGYRGVGIDQIAEAVGLAGPSVYGHFPSKLDILVDAYYRATAAVDVGAEAALRQAGSADDALSGLARSYVEAAFANVDFLIVAGRELHSIPESERPRLARRRRAIRDTWVAVLRQVRADLTDGEAHVLVNRVLYLVVNTVENQRDGRPGVEELAALVRAFLLAGER